MKVKNLLGQTSEVDVSDCKDGTDLQAKIDSALSGSFQLFFLVSLLQTSHIHSDHNPLTANCNLILHSITQSIFLFTLEIYDACAIFASQAQLLEENLHTLPTAMPYSDQT